MTAPERVIARILARVVITPDDCWQWQGAKTRGYGQIGWHDGGRPRRALVHRVMYEAAFGQVPEGAQVDHRCHDPRECAKSVATECKHRACCNPFHLAAVTNRQNVLRGGSFAAENAVKTACPNGHTYDTANTYVTPNGWRQCRACRTAHVRALRQRHQSVA